MKNICIVSFTATCKFIIIREMYFYYIKWGQLTIILEQKIKVTQALS